MVGYITTAHDRAQRLSEKWRHFVVHCLYSLFCTSPRCVGVPVFGGGGGGGGGGWFQTSRGLRAPGSVWRKYGAI